MVWKQEGCGDEGGGRVTGKGQEEGGWSGCVGFGEEFERLVIMDV